MKQLNTVIHGNFLDNNLPDKCAKLIIADPPYYEVKGEFDFIWSTFAKYLEDVRKWGKECKRLLNENGTLLWYGQPKKIAYTQIILDEYFDLLNSLVWNKGRGYMDFKAFSSEMRTFPDCTERILMYSHETYNLTECVYIIRDYIRQEIVRKNGKIVLKHVNEALGTATNGGGVASSCLSLDKVEPTMITEEMYSRLQDWLGSGYLIKSYSERSSEYEKLRTAYEATRRPFNNEFNLQEVLNFSNEQNTTGAKYDHLTVKPETLTRALILTLSRPGDLIVVPFAGSGTECSMAAKEGRDFVGYEINPKHVKTASRRSKEHTQQQSIFKELNSAL
jgi:site-specific DNA-methyltransferase (adenine-specific)